MGVRECDRNDCDHIMCDYLIYEQYICNECISEFRDLVGPKDRTEKEFIKLFLDFMKSPKELGSNRIITVDEFLKAESNDFE